VDGNDQPEVAYVTSTCGAHTCWDRLYVLGWDGDGFVNYAADMPDYPYPTFELRDRQIVVRAGAIASAGAGLQRTYEEVWRLDGQQFSQVERQVGPATARIHYVHDGDAALARGNYGAAVDHFQMGLDDTSLPTGLVWADESVAEIVLEAYARFKLMVAYAASGDMQSAASEYDALVDNHPEETPGYIYAVIGEAFWREFEATGAPRSACQAAVAVAEEKPEAAESLYSGYANPEYEPTDLCRLTQNEGG
jgi:hypothetical protein